MFKRIQREQKSNKTYSNFKITYCVKKSDFDQRGNRKDILFFVDFFHF